MTRKLALPLSRRVLLKAVSGLGLTLGCGEGVGELLVDGFGPIEDPNVPPYPLDTEGDDEMQSAVHSKLYDPLFLFAECVVSTGGSVSPNTVALMNPHGLPMELLAVQWRIFPVNNVVQEGVGVSGMGIGVKLDMGAIPVVDAEVPVSAFGTARDTAERNNVDTIFTNQGVNEAVANAYTYKWRLKHPLFVPPGCVVTPTYSHLGQTKFPVVVQTLYICRSLPTRYTVPAQLFAPWVGSYNSTSFDTNEDQPAGRDTSSELDIVNPFRQPLELARIVGNATLVVTSPLPFSLETNGYLRYQLGKMRIRARSGDEIARSPTPFNGLFSFGWRAWDVPPGWQLRPGEFYKLFLSVDETTEDVLDVGSVQFSVSATGFRKLSSATFIAAAQGEM